MRPVVDMNHESNIEGLFLAGSIIDAPGICVSANQGHRISEYISALSKQLGPPPVGVKDLIIAGAGPTGLNAAMTAMKGGLDIKVFDQYFMGATLLGMPEGKIFHVGYKGNKERIMGELWFEDATSPKLHSHWRKQAREHKIPLIEHERVTTVVRELDTGYFKVRTRKGSYRSRKVLIAIGKAGYPRHLNVMGELLLKNKNQLYYKYRGDSTMVGRSILIIGGGNTAIEAALDLAQRNEVTIIYRKAKFSRLSESNRNKIGALMRADKVKVMFNSNILSFETNGVRFIKDKQIMRMNFDEYFILIGFDIPLDFLKRIGVKVE